MKHAHPKPDTAAHPLEATCHAILAGDFTGLPKLEYVTYSDHEWREAAQAAIECEDFSEVRWMIDHENENDREERAEYAAQVRGYNKPLTWWRT